MISEDNSPLIILQVKMMANILEATESAYFPAFKRMRLSVTLG